MICAKCGAENPDEAHFCGACGTNIGSEFDSPPGPVSNLGGYEENDKTTGIESGGSTADDSPAIEPPPKYEPKVPSFSEPVPIPTKMPEPPKPVPPVHQPPVNPNAPGAGLAPQQVPPPPPPGTYQQQPQQPYGQPGQQQSGYVAPQSYGYGTPSDGNTSGMGEGFQVPREAEGWTFAGFVPYGLFAFINGNVLWGVIGLFVPLVHMIYIGISGKKLAWQGRRFDSMQQYLDTMKAWNSWGIGLCVLNVIGTILYFLMIIGFAMMEETGM